MRNILMVAVLLVANATLFAGPILPKAVGQNINPTVLHFNNDQQVLVHLSKTGINRLFVQGDKIISMAAPSNYLLERHDQQGSVYVNVLTNKPFSAFVVTQGGRHFALMMLPKAIPAQTIELIANNPTQAEIIKAKNSPYQQRLINITRSLLRGQTPSGMAEQKILQPQAITYQQGQLIPVMRYHGAILGAEVLRFTNTGKQTITLSPNQFYHSGVLAVSLTQQSIAPEHSTQVMEVLRGKSASSEGFDHD